MIGYKSLRGRETERRQVVECDQPCVDIIIERSYRRVNEEHGVWAKERVDSGGLYRGFISYALF